MTDPEEPAHLPVHLVETHGDGGHVTTHLTTDCPPLERVVSVDECVVCPRCRGLMVLPDRSRPTVACKPMAPPLLRDADAAAATATNRDDEALAAARVGEAMTRDVICFRLDTPLDEVARVLIERRVSGAPVLDDHSRLTGVISKSDLLVRRPSDVRVADVLTHLAFCLPETATLAQAAALMAYEGVHRIPIVSPDRHVVGLLSAIDVLRWLARRSGLLSLTEDAMSPMPPESPAESPDPLGSRGSR